MAIYVEREYRIYGEGPWRWCVTDCGDEGLQIRYEEDLEGTWVLKEEHQMPSEDGIAIAESILKLYGSQQAEG